MNEIINIRDYSEHTCRLTIRNEAVARAARPGHFVIVCFSGDMQRIPFTIVSTDREAGTIDIIIHKAANLDAVRAGLRAGDSLPHLLGPLGSEIKIENFGTVVCIGDGAGFVPLMPVASALSAAGNRVISVISEQSSVNTCLQSDIAASSESVTIVEDGSPADTLSRIISGNRVDRIFMTGPTTMMKELADTARRHGIPATCILNMIMVDGIGLCGTCRVIVDGKRRLTCIDGPAFDALAVDFDQLLNRQRHFV